jgi:hypothetical protein
LSYTLDWDGNLDETIALSGSSTVGGWTASGSVSYNRDRRGCSDRDATVKAGDNATTPTLAGLDDNATNVATVCAGTQVAGDDSSSVTVTDGTMTIKLGDASHLSSQNVSTNGAAAGAVTFDSADDDASVGALVGGFHGVSLSYKISDAMSATVAYQASADVADACGAGEAYDGETTATHGTTGTGLGFSGTFGIIGVGATICNASTNDAGTSTTSPGSTSTATSTMGVGVTVDLGDIKPFISFGTYLGVGNVSKSGEAYAGNEVGLTFALGSDTIVAYVGSVAEIDTSDGTALETLTKSGMELGYNTTVGPAALAVGYGTQTHAQTDGATDGYSMTDIEVAMTYSF